MDLKGIKLILNGPDYLHANPQWCRDALVFLVERVEKLEQKNNKQMQTVAHDPCTGCANTIEDIPLFDCVACGKGSAD